MRTAAFLMLFASVVGAQFAHAEIGVPANKGGAYLSIEGGYQNLDASGTAAQGASEVQDGNVGGASASCATQASAPPPGPGGVGCGVGAGTERAIGRSDGGTFIEAADGGYGSLTFGYVLPSSVLGLINRLELAGQLARGRDDQSSLGGFGMRSVDNATAIAFAAAPIEINQVTVDSRFETTEITLRLKSDIPLSPSGALVTMTFEPFYFGMDQDVTTSATQAAIIGASAKRTTEIDSDGFGALLGLEGQIPIANNFFLIGRGYAGLYHLSVDAIFKDEIRAFGPLFHAVTDEEDMDGYRLGGEAGVRMNLTPAAWLSLIGKVDWMSEVPVAVLPRFQGDLPAHIEDDDLFIWQFGIRLTLTGN